MGQPAVEGMFLCWWVKTTGVGREVCWSVKQLGK